MFGQPTGSSVGYLSFDVCNDTLSRTFDLVIAEHVQEHVTQPDRAGRNIRAMLRPGGHALIVCPFLCRIHADPVDCTRWTETGISNLLTQAGFSLGNVRTGSWGNRSCARAVMDNEWLLYNRYLRSLENEPTFPVVVWAIAKRDP